MSDGSLAYAVTSLFDRMDIFILIFVRLIGFFLLLPIIAGNNIPNQVKVTLAVFTAFIIFTTNKVTTVQYYDSIFGYGMLIAQELVVGLTLAFAAYAIFSIVYFAGQLIDYQIGFSMLSVLDPVSQIQVPITGNLIYYVMMMLLVQIGGLHVLIYVIATSYDILPIGSAVLVNNADITNSLLHLLSQYFSLGAQIAMPIAGTIVVIDFMLGIMVKAAPQMNVFVIGMPIKVFIGLGILWIITPVFSSVFDSLFKLTQSTMAEFMRVMSP